MIDPMPTYFNEQELNELRALKGKVLLRVLYTIWRNIANPAEPYEALDWIELIFVDGTEIAFTRAEESNGMEIRELNFAMEQTRIVQQFRGQVEWERVDMSSSSIWENCIGSPVTGIGLEHHGVNMHPSHTIHLTFGGQTQELGLGEEGLIVRQMPSG